MRELRQQEAVDSFYPGRRSLIKACPRFGKIKVSLDIFKKLNIKKALICLPRVDIQKSWIDDAKKWGWEGELIFTTHRSMEKMAKLYEVDITVIDEIHECSVNQLKVIENFTGEVLALSGTVTYKTETEIATYADIYSCYEYDIDQGVREGILSDYEIIIHTVPLSIYEKGKWNYMEKLTKKLIEEKKDTFFLDLRKIKLLQKSYSKLNKTKELLKEFEDERVLCFCGLTETADKLGIPVYHSKSKEKLIFDDFCAGKGKQLATIKMMQAGITITPINIGVVNYFSGNPEDTAQKITRFLGLEWGNPNKKAVIHLLLSDTNFEKSRLDTALMFFNRKKITKR